jgi:transposase
MINNQDITFSDTLSRHRIFQAQKILSGKVVNRLICFALYLLGVNRKSISNSLKIPAGSVRSIIRAILHSGLPAFEDRRRSRSDFLPPQEKKTPRVTICLQEEYIVIDFDESGQVKIPRKNHLQAKAVLLTLFNNDLLKSSEVAKVFDITTAHVLNLAREMDVNDISALIDKRQGQKQEYRFTSEVKSELIQQFVLDIVVEGRTSGRLLSERIEQRCKLSLSERSIRHYIKELGLSRIKKSLPPLLAHEKKT